MVEVARGRLSNVHREIANPLQIDGNPDYGNHKSKIDGDGLLKRQQREAALVDIGLKLVETLIVRRHPTGQRAVAGEQSIHGDPHLLFGEAAHDGEPVLEGVQIFVDST
jgi:hypothetical protein